MSFTLRGMISGAWNTFLRVNPITGPYYLAQDVANTQFAKDAVKVTTETAAKAAKATQDAANAVLDYPIDQGAKKAYDATASVVGTAYNATASAVGTAYDATSKTVVGAYDATVDGINTGIKVAGETYDAAVDTVADGIVTGVQTVDDTQKGIRRDIAEAISPDAPKAPAAPPAAPQPQAPVAPAHPKADLPKTAAETKAFQQQFNAWLGSDAGKGARDAGAAPLAVDGICGPATKYALALYNAS